MGLQLFSQQAGQLVAASCFAWITAIIQLVFVLAGTAQRSNRFFLIGLFLSCFAAVVPGYYFRPHYFVMLLPVVSLLAGTAVSALPGYFEAQSEKMLLLREALAVSLLVLFIFPVLSLERQYLFLDSPRQVCVNLNWDSTFPESQEVAAYLKANTAPTDKIAVLGSEPQLFFYADRLSATRHIYMYGLMEDQPFARRMQDELIRDITVARPKYIVHAAISKSWLFTEKSERTIIVWAEDFLARHYHLVGTVNIIDQENRQIYWGNDALLFYRQSPVQLLVYRANE
jgi:hypothetical protein